VATAPDRSVAVVTPSFRRDLELCRLLSESVHLAFPEPVHHYIVVDHNDLALFKPLADRRTTVLDTYDVLPSRLLRKVPRMNKWVWVGHHRPVLGWVVQQIMKFAFAFHVTEDVLIVSDSDAIFLRPLSIDDVVIGGRTLLAREPAAIGPHLPDHVEWNDNAHQLLGLTRPTYPADDYISNVVVWDRVVAQRTCQRVETTTGQRWDKVLARRRAVSEFLLYGVYATHVAPELVQPVTGSVCISEWGHDRVSEEQFVSLLVDGKPHQFAASISAHSMTTPAERERMIRAHVPLFASR
jgi:hypothetical protein